MFKSIAFVLRIAIAWGMVVFVVAALYASIPLLGRFELPVVLLGTGTMALVIGGAFSHLRRVRLIAGHIDGDTLGNRQKRLVEIPLEAGEAFDLLDAAIRELPGAEQIQSARDSLQVKAKVARPRTYGEHPLRRWNPLLWFGLPRNQLQATVTPGEDSGRVTLICEPENPAWSDWFLVDDGTNYENAEAIVRAITRRIGELRRGERASAAHTATQKELTEAKLHLLHAQVEPHFLYNTLASAQLLTRSDPARAEAMLGHLIQYLRRSLPNAEGEMSTLGGELERALAAVEAHVLRRDGAADVQGVQVAGRGVVVEDALIALPAAVVHLVVVVARSSIEPVPLIVAQHHGHAVAAVEQVAVAATDEQVVAAAPEDVAGLVCRDQALGRLPPGQANAIASLPGRIIRAASGRHLRVDEERAQDVLVGQGGGAEAEALDAKAGIKEELPHGDHRRLAVQADQQVIAVAFEGPEFLEAFINDQGVDVAWSGVHVEDQLAPLGVDVMAVIVVAKAAEQAIYPAAAFQQITARTVEQDVVATAGEHSAGTGLGDEQIVARGAIDEQAGDGGGHGRVLVVGSGAPQHKGRGPEDVRIRV